MITIHFCLNKEKEFEELNLVQIHDGYLLPLSKHVIERIEEDLANEICEAKCEADNHYEVKMQLNYERDGAGVVQASHWSIVEMFNYTCIDRLLNY
jgi:hypothetical protein